VAVECFDGSPVLFRRLAGMIPYARDEIGFGPDESDPVAIWDGGPNAVPATTPKSKILVAVGNMRVSITNG
jgi:hypothetical protein